MKKIFILASGRSGTQFLCDLFKNNVKNCISEHEPEPDLFGEPIYWYYKGEYDKIRKLFLKKKKIIDSHNADVYIEANHAFLKSFKDIAMEYYSDMKLVHLIRNPLKVVKSELNREQWLNSFPIRFYPIKKYYRAEDGKKYFRWKVIREEKIFKDVKGISLTPYQEYVVQWIEIENRAMDFLKKYKKHDDCLTLDTPKNLNDKEKIRELFNFMNVELEHEDILIEGKKNVNKRPTIITEEEKKQFQELVNNIPDKYLKIFKEEPYKNLEWIDIFNKKNVILI